MKKLNKYMKNTFINKIKRFFNLNEKPLSQSVCDAMFAPYRVCLISFKMNKNNSKTLVFGCAGSGNTSKICIPAMVDSNLPVIYFGRPFQKRELDYLANSGKKVIPLNTETEGQVIVLTSASIFAVDTYDSNIKNNKPRINIYTYLKKSGIDFNEVLIVVDEFEYLNNKLDSSLMLFPNLLITSHYLDDEFYQNNIKELMDYVILLRSNISLSASSCRSLSELFDIDLVQMEKFIYEENIIDLREREIHPVRFIPYFGGDE